jgi:uncharacterized protein YdcH (DUF465 family)
MNDLDKIIKELENVADSPRAKDIADIFRGLYDKNKELEDRVSDLEYENKPDSEKYIT